MNLRPLLYSLVCIILSSCDQRQDEIPLSRTDAGFKYYELGKQASETREKITHFNKALQLLQDPADSLIPDVLDHKIYYHIRLKEYDSSLYYADKLIETAAYQNDTSYLATGYYRKGTIYRYLNQPEKAYENALKSREYYLELSDSTGYARRTSEIAAAQLLITDFAGAQQTATEALRYFGQKDSAYISSTYNTIGSAYRNLGFNKEALKEYRNALSYATTQRDSLSQYNNIALCLRDLDRHDESIQLFLDILNRENITSESSRARYIDNLAFTRWLKDSLDVQEDLFRAVEIRKQIGDNNGLLASYDHLSEFYKTRNQKLAKAYADSLLLTARKLGSKSAKLNALQKLIDLSLGKEAKRLSALYIRINDSLNTERLRNKNLFAKISYDEEEKQRMIAHLEDENLARALETSRLENRLIVLSLGGTIILILAGFGTYYLRQRHKREHLQGIYATESRISKKIHDELANDIYNIMSNLEHSASEENLNRLESVYSRTRDISRENRSIDTGEHYLQNLNSMLTSNTPAGTRIIIRGQEEIRWERLRTEKKIVVYRVLQELMVNMKKYSGAGLVAIVFSKQGKYLSISYSDTGIGCSPAELKNANGLQNVENRIFSVDGSISFEVEKGKGFKSNIKIPI